MCYTLIYNAKRCLLKNGCLYVNTLKVLLHCHSNSWIRKKISTGSCLCLTTVLLRWYFNLQGLHETNTRKRERKTSSDYSSQTRILLFYVFCFFVFFSTNSKIVLLSFCFDYQQDAKASHSAYLIIRIVVQMVFCDKEENMKSCQPFAANCPFNYDEDMQKAYNVAKSGGQRRQQNFSHEAHSVLNLSDSFVWFSSEFNWTLNWSMCCGPFHIKPLGPKQFTQLHRYAITHLQMFKWTGYKHKKPSSSQQ